MGERVSRRGTRRRVIAATGGHDGPDERWMASYLDMITVLMCLFIVLFAMSSVDQQKFEQLSASLAEGFGGETTEMPEFIGNAEEGVDAATEARTELEELTALQEKLRTALHKAGADGAATLTIDERGLTVGLVSADTFFATNSTELSPRAVTVLGAIGGVLASVPNEISVEGHADHRTAAAPFATNWELASSRATQVLRFLVEKQSLSPQHVKSVGFGDAQPIASGDSAQALAQNRRVDIVVLSEATEDVRDLIPGLQGAAKAP